MKKFYLLTILCFGILAFNVQAQKDKDPVSKKKTNEELKLDTRIDNMRYWMKKAEAGLVQYNPVIPFKPAEYKSSKLSVPGVKTTNSPDVAVSDPAGSTQSENSIFVDPTDNTYVLNSNNSTPNPVAGIYGANYFQTADAGATWGGSVNGAGGDNSGDPTTAIGLGGRQYVNFISSSSGQGIAHSNDGINWTTAEVAPNPGSLADKNHMWIDNSPTSPYEGNLYVAWTPFGGSDDAEIVISRSTDDGLGWSTPLNISSAVAAGSHNQGVNIQTGPNGEVYVVWTIYDSWPSDETAMGFAKSIDGGLTYTTATRIITNIRGIRTTETSKNHRVNSFPSMACDISTGPNSGNLYVVWSNVGTPGVNTGSNISVYMIRSTDGGTNWNTPIRVNQNPYMEGEESYFPWICCDPETGVIATVFYDDRNIPGDPPHASCETFSAYSQDGGITWFDFQVSDVSFTPAPISGLAASYMGDYLGISARGGMVYPCWTDNRSGHMTYVSPYELGLNAGFTADDTEVCTGSAVNFTNTSTGDPISWNWSFPGGSPSSFEGQNPPAITYNTPGTFNVSLTVGDGVDSDTETKTGFITVKNVIADFAASPTSVVTGNTVTFTDNSSCGPTSWNWTFPGGTPSSFSGQTPPPIQYDTEGSYDVTLSVTNASGTDVLTIPGYITVVPPEFNMQNGTVTTCEGNFYDSGGPLVSYTSSENLIQTFYPSTPGAMMQFNFTLFDTEGNYDFLHIYNGENTSAPLIGSYHGITDPGTITASNASGAITFNFISDVSVTNLGWSAIISCYSSSTPPVAEFSASITSPAINSDVLFTDLSNNVPTSWSWSFNPSTVVYVNGTSATSQNPEVQFTALGYYTVTLTATNAFGSDAETKTDYINVISYTYCDASGGGDEYISGVQLETINNTGTTSDNYVDYTSLSTDLTLGQNYSITVSNGNVYSTDDLGVWIDWNQNGVFTDADENVVCEISNGGEGTYAFDVPATATPGSTRMRVRIKYNGTDCGTPCGTTTYGEVEDYTVNVLGGHVTLDLKAYLEGPFNGTEMGANIVQLLPLSQPFNTSPWNYTGTESVVSIPNANVVEWILIDVRDAATAATATSASSVAKQAAFILNDGSIVDLDGSSDLQFDISISQNMFVVVLQRNHLGIITNDPITPSAGVYTYDFTTGINQVFGGVDGHKEISIGIWGMIGGDANHDGTVNVNDKSPVWENEAGEQGYIYSDHNLDGQTNNQDKDDVWVPNENKSSQVPN